MIPEGFPISTPAHLLDKILTLKSKLENIRSPSGKIDPAKSPDTWPKLAAPQQAAHTALHNLFVAIITHKIPFSEDDCMNRFFMALTIGSDGGYKHARSCSTELGHIIVFLRAVMLYESASLDDVDLPE